MSDRELLELAANAAGLRVRTWEGHSGIRCAIDDDRHGQMWMPLTDDGDALRLAVQLGIGGTWHQPLRYATGVHVPYGPGPVIRIEEHGTDPYAATRRAIVRAAAEIGRSKP